jgi:hypothetical protein
MRDKQARHGLGGPMARSGPLLSQAHRKKIVPLPSKPRENRRGGRPRTENVRVLEWILTSLRASRKDLSAKYPRPST